MKKTKLSLRLSTIRVLSAASLSGVAGGAIKNSCDPYNPCQPPPPTAEPTYMGCPSQPISCCCPK